MTNPLSLDYKADKSQTHYGSTEIHVTNPENLAEPTNNTRKDIQRLDFTDIEAESFTENDEMEKIMEESSLARENVFEQWIGNKIDSLFKTLQKKLDIDDIEDLKVIASELTNLAGPPGSAKMLYEAYNAKTVDGRKLNNADRLLNLIVQVPYIIAIALGLHGNIAEAAALYGFSWTSEKFRMGYALRNLPKAKELLAKLKKSVKSDMDLSKFLNYIEQAMNKFQDPAIYLGRQNLKYDEQKF